MRVILKIILGLLIILIIAMFTKPSDESCRKKASALVEARLKKDMRDANLANNLLDRLIDMASIKKVGVEDKVFYKEIKFTFNGKTRTIGHGLFGYVNVDWD